MWPVSYALTKWSPGVEKKIAPDGLSATFTYEGTPPRSLVHRQR